MSLLKVRAESIRGLGNQSAIDTQEGRRTMTRKVQEFSASAALVELEFQERLLRALTCELDRMRKETNYGERSERENTEPMKPESSRGSGHHWGTGKEEFSCE